MKPTPIRQLIIKISVSLTNEPCWDTSYQCIRRNIFGDHSPRGNHRSLTKCYPRQNCRSSTNHYIIFNTHFTALRMVVRIIDIVLQGKDIHLMANIYTISDRKTTSPVKNAIKMHNRVIADRYTLRRKHLYPHFKIRLATNFHPVQKS